MGCPGGCGAPSCPTINQAEGGRVGCSRLAPASPGRGSSRRRAPRPPPSALGDILRRVNGRDAKPGERRARKPGLEREMTGGLCHEGGMAKVWGPPWCGDPRAGTCSPPPAPPPWALAALPPPALGLPTEPRAGSLNAAREGPAEPRPSRKKPVLGSKWSPWSRRGPRLHPPGLPAPLVLPLLPPAPEGWGKVPSSPPGARLGPGPAWRNTQGREGWMEGRRDGWMEGAMDGGRTQTLCRSSLPVPSRLRVGAGSVPRHPRAVSGAQGASRSCRKAPRQTSPLPFGPPHSTIPSSAFASAPAFPLPTPTVTEAAPRLGHRPPSQTPAPMGAAVRGDSQRANEGLASLVEMNGDRRWSQGRGKAMPGPGHPRPPGTGGKDEGRKAFTGERSHRPIRTGSSQQCSDSVQESKRQYSNRKYLIFPISTFHFYKLKRKNLIYYKISVQRQRYNQKKARSVSKRNSGEVQREPAQVRLRWVTGYGALGIKPRPGAGGKTGGANSHPSTAL